MKLARRTLLHLAAIAAALPTISRIARAQTYPARPITIIVPVPPGGVADPIARILADRLTMRTGSCCRRATPPQRTA
jgi:tripartite-type tricarboxylate transporter receptor subunit TctC